MVDADARADLRAARVSRESMPSSASIARAKDRRGVFEHRGVFASDERRPKARVNPEIDECSTHAKHATRLAECARHIVEIGVRENRDDSVELSILKRKCVSVRLHKPRRRFGVLPRDFELIARYVGSDNRPPGPRKSRNRASRSAAEVET